MKKIITIAAMFAAALGGQAQYQVQNSGFEEWEDVSYGSKTGQEPVNWNSFLTGTGGLKSAAGYNQLEKSEETRPGSTGVASAKLYDRKVVWTTYAQGNLTTGCINMGSMSASDANGNYNYTKTDDENYNQKFTGKPDMMRVWVKYVSTKGYNGKVTALLHTEGYYQDPLGNEGSITATKVGEATKSDVASSEEWQELNIPVAYAEGVTERPAYALISFSTNVEPGKGTGSDYMLVDDLEFVYNSELTSCMYDGAEIFENGALKDMSEVVYDAAKVGEMLSNGAGAAISYEYDAETRVLTVTVKGDNYADDETNVHTYTTTFAEPIVPCELATLSFKDTDYSEQITEDEAIVIDDVYSMAALNVASADSLAKVSKKYDAATGTLTIDIIGSDIETQPENMHHYTVKFQAPVDSVVYTDALAVSINGTPIANAPADILLYTMSDNTRVLALNEFKINLGADIPVGNIVVEGLELTEDGHLTNVGEVNRNIEIFAGNDADAEYLGPQLGIVPIEMTSEMYGTERMHAAIAIDMQALRQSIDVKFGKAFVSVNDTTAVEAADVHVLFNHSLKAGWNTVCLPFGTTAEALAGEGASAQAFDRVDEHALYFAKVDTMEAGKPYMVWCANDTEIDNVMLDCTLTAKADTVVADNCAFVGTLAPATPAGMLTIVLDEENVQRLAAAEEGAEVKSLNAYFTYSGESSVSVEGLPLQMEGEADVTGISNVANSAAAANAAVYDLSGRRVKNAAKGGIYIVGGKKVIK